MNKEKLKVFHMTVEEFEKRFPVKATCMMPPIPKGHIARFVTVKPVICNLENCR